MSSSTNRDMNLSQVRGGGEREMHTHAIFNVFAAAVNVRGPHSSRGGGRRRCGREAAGLFAVFSSRSRGECQISAELGYGTIMGSASLV